MSTEAVQLRSLFEQIKFDLEILVRVFTVEKTYKVITLWFNV